jgi:hypothetical protein
VKGDKYGEGDGTDFTTPAGKKTSNPPCYELRKTKASVKCINIYHAVRIRGIRHRITSEDVTCLFGDWRCTFTKNKTVTSSVVFWVVTPCRLVGSFHLPPTTCKTTRRHNPEDHSWHLHRRENLKFLKTENITSIARNFQTYVLCYCSYLIDPDVHLLQAQLYCCKTNHTSDIIMQSRELSILAFR